MCRILISVLRINTVFLIHGTSALSLDFKGFPLLNIRNHQKYFVQDCQQSVEIQIIN